MSNLGTTANISTLLRRLESACSAMKRLKWTVYRLLVSPYRNAARDGHFASVLKQHPLGSRSREHSVDACARPSGNRGGCWCFPAAIRAYAPWAVHTLELDGAADLPQFVYGLSRIGKMQVFTSSGAGTWDRRCGWDQIPKLLCLSSSKVTRYWLT